MSRRVTIPLKGKLIKSQPAASIGNNFQNLINMEYADNHPKGIPGMTKINTSAISTYLKVRNAHHFTKAQPSESHLLVQGYNTGLTASQVLQNTTAIPSQGNFSGTALWTDSSGAGKGYFSKAPNGDVAYCNEVDTCIWGGDEMPVGMFINYDPNGTFEYDYTEQVGNTMTDSLNVATVQVVSGGLDSNVMLLLSLNNNVTDTSPTTVHTVTNTNVTFSTTTVFGSHAASFNGTTAYLSVPDNADFSYTAGSLTVDGRFKLTDLVANQIIYYQKTDVLKVDFTSGSEEPSVGDTIVGATGGATAIVDYISDLSGGTWAGGTAAGTIYVHTQSGTFQAEDLNIQGGSANVMSIGGNTTDAGDNYMKIYVNTSGAIYCVVHECYGSGSDVVSFYTPNSTISAGTWYHIEVVEDSSNWYIFVDGVRKAYASDSSRARNYIGTVYIGYDGTNFYKGLLDEFRVSNSARHTEEFEIPLAAYSTDTTQCYFYVGGIRPLQGIKFYVGTANDTAGTMSIDYWDGDSWTAVSSLSDGTAVSGKTLAQTGSATFTSTESVSKVRAINGNVLYWYRVSLTAVNAATTIYYVTLDAPFQTIKDIWDGSDRGILSFQTYDNSTYNEYTLNVRENNYNSANSGTYAELDSMTAGTDYLVFGFYERMMGINISLIGGHVNTTADTILTVYYWNGTTWTTVGTIVDGTIEGAKSFAKSGTVTWNSPTSSIEFQTDLNQQKQMYYYKFVFSQNLSADVQMYYASGIPVQKNLSGYKFPFFSNYFLYLCADMKGKKNQTIRSAFHSSCIFNGDESYIHEFGDDSELTCACSLFSLFGSTLYTHDLFFKDRELWSLSGTGTTLNQYLVSPNIGCPAPQTLKVVNFPLETAPGQNRTLAIWQGTDGVFMSDGRSPVPIHHDVEHFFDKNNSSCINATKIGDSTAFVDETNMCYHWCFASGSSTTLNEEWVFDLRRWQWYEIDRGTGKYLQCGIEVRDTNGNFYNYGFIDTGYCERLRYGTTFDGGDITCTMHTGDMAPLEDIALDTRISRINLVGVAKTNTSNSITYTHYTNGETSSTKTATISPVVSDKSVFNDVHNINSKIGVLHSFKFTMTTDNETVGFEPLFLAAYVKDEQEHLKSVSGGS